MNVPHFFLINCTYIGARLLACDLRCAGGCAWRCAGPRTPLTTLVSPFFPYTLYYRIVNPPTNLCNVSFVQVAMHGGMQNPEAGKARVEAVEEERIKAQ